MAIDKIRLLRQAQKAQKEIKKQIIEAEGGGGAVVVEVTADQKIKQIYIDPDQVDLKNISQLEGWLKEALQSALEQSRKILEEKMRPYLGQISNLMKK